MSLSVKTGKPDPLKRKHNVHAYNTKILVPTLHETPYVSITKTNHMMFREIIGVYSEIVSTHARGTTQSSFNVKMHDVCVNHCTVVGLILKGIRLVANSVI
jgi:hypothetical protein